MGCAQSTVKKPEQVSVVVDSEAKDASQSSLTTRNAPAKKSDVQYEVGIVENVTVATASASHSNSTVPFSSKCENAEETNAHPDMEHTYKEHYTLAEQLLSNGKDGLVAVENCSEINGNANVENVISEQCNAVNARQVERDDIVHKDNAEVIAEVEKVEERDFHGDNMDKIANEFETNDVLLANGSAASSISYDNNNRKENSEEEENKINGNEEKELEYESVPHSASTSTSSLSFVDVVEDANAADAEMKTANVNDEHLKWNEALAYKGVGKASQHVKAHNGFANDRANQYNQYTHGVDDGGDNDSARINRYGSHSEDEELLSEWQSEQLLEDDLQKYKMNRTLSMPSSLSSSIPQLFRLPHLSQSNMKAEEGSWEWWYHQVRRQRVTHDRNRKEMLQNIHNHLTRQHENTPQNVELDLSELYMERGGPYMLAKFLTSVHLPELRWITLLRLDGNYFTERGLGSLLATLSHANEISKSGPLFPVLRQLYLNNMNLTHNDIGGIMFYLFPVDAAALACARETQPNKANSTSTHVANKTSNGNAVNNDTSNNNNNHDLPNGQNGRAKRAASSELDRINGSRAGPPSENYLTQLPMLPHMQLFPALSILSLSDNTMLGDAGLAELLRYMLAPHFDHHTLHILDISRCGLTTNAIAMLGQYEHKVGKALRHNNKIVHVTTMALLGNFTAHDLEQNLRRSSRVQIKFIC